MRSKIIIALAVVALVAGIALSYQPEVSAAAPSNPKGNGCWNGGIQVDTDCNGTMNFGWNTETSTMQACLDDVWDYEDTAAANNYCYYTPSPACTFDSAC